MFYSEFWHWYLFTAQVFVEVSWHMLHTADILSREKIHAGNTVSYQASAAVPLLLPAAFTSRPHSLLGSSSQWLWIIQLPSLGHINPISESSIGILHVGAADWAGQNFLGLALWEPFSPVFLRSLSPFICTVQAS